MTDLQTDVQTYAPGTYCWIDLASTDLERSKEFYTGLFGWDAFTIPGPDAGGYGFFLKNGKQAAGYGPTMMDEQPSAWNAYVAAEDADAIANKVQAGGGQVIAGPMDVMDQGRMAVFTDPSGAFFSIWQGAQMQGLEVRNEPGSFCWAELNTRDVDGAKRFYSSVFGWGADTEASENGSYTEWKLDGNSIAGMMDVTGMVPDSVPPHWRVYLTVENADETAARAQELGGEVTVPVMEIPLGRFAVLSDPAGAIFGIMEFKQG